MAHDHGHQQDPHEHDGHLGGEAWATGEGAVTRLDRTRIGRRHFLGLAALGGAAAALVGCEPPVKTYTFSVAGKGAIRYDLNAFGDHALHTLNHFSGWSLGNALGFRRVPSGGNFTLWLCEARLVPSYSSVCSSMWSCRVGRNVIINQDRWLGATATWPYGLEEYRHYVVNHETGHWLGMPHWRSGGRGNPCPVMFQQSKGITDGSIYQTWPIPAERSWVSQHHGVPIRYHKGAPVPADQAGASAADVQE